MKRAQQPRVPCTVNIDVPEWERLQAHLRGRFGVSISEAFRRGLGMYLDAAEDDTPGTPGYTPSRATSGEHLGTLAAKAGRG